MSLSDRDREMAREIARQINYRGGGPDGCTEFIHGVWKIVFWISSAGFLVWLLAFDESAHWIVWVGLIFGILFFFPWNWFSKFRD